MHEPNPVTPVHVITGASSGIGKATAQALAATGATIALVCRDRERGESARAELRRATGNPRIDLWLADLAALAQVRQLAAELGAAYPAIDVLINNAGVMLSRRETSADGFELHLAVNHLAPLLLTRLLEPALRAAAAARVVNVASEVHRFGRIRLDDLQRTGGYRGFTAYGASKLALMLATQTLAARWRSCGIAVNSLHPGVINTNLGATPRWIKRHMPSPQRGARTSVYLATAPAAAGVTGQYFINCRPARAGAAAYDAAARAALWQSSCELVGLPAD